MRALLLRKGKKEVDRREGRRGKGRGRDLPDQCQTASYAPAPHSLGDVACCVVFARWQHHSRRTFESSERF